MPDWEDNEYSWERADRLRLEAETRFEKAVGQVMQAFADLQNPHKTISINLNHLDVRSRIGLSLGWNPLKCPIDLGERREDSAFVTGILRLVAGDHIGISGLGYAATAADFRSALSVVTALRVSVFPPKSVSI